ncbi:MAG: WD40 repeat domain-containing protein, partial [Spirulina sp. SIO3F2]|nr:WD40 repeat domain-containing protein [Spirulina sp. SIO3F2]
VSGNSYNTLKKNLIRSLSYLTEYNRFNGHSGGITDVVFSNSGEIIATSSLDKKITFWSSQGRQIAIIEDNRAPVFGLAFSPDDRLIATADFTGVIKLFKIEASEESSWNISLLEAAKVEVEKGKEPHLPSSLYEIEFSNDGSQLLAAGADGTVKRWNILGGKLSKRKNQIIKAHDSEIWDIAISPDDKILATASWDKTIKLWKINSDGNIEKEPYQTLRQHQNKVLSIDFSPDGQNFITSDSDGKIIVWDLQGQKKQTISVPSGSVRRVRYSPDGKSIATVSDDYIVRVWHKNPQGHFGHDLMREFNGHQGDIWGISYSPDSKTLATASWDRTVKLWKLKSEYFTSFKVHNGDLISLDYNKDSNILVTGGEDRDVKIWDLEDGTSQVLEGHKDYITSVDFSADGKMLATASGDTTIRLWNQESTNKSNEFSTLDVLNAHEFPVWSTKFANNERVLISADTEGNLMVWEYDKNNNFNKTPKMTKAHGGPIWSIAFHPNDQEFATASTDSTIKIWKLSNLEDPVQIISGEDSSNLAVQYSPKGNILATANANGAVHLWQKDFNNLFSKTPYKTLKGHKAEVWSLDFSANDQNFLATSSWDGTVKLWNIEGEELVTIKVSEGDIRDIDFSSDENDLAFGDSTGSIFIYSNIEQMISSKSLLEQACEEIEDYLKYNSLLTDQERKICDPF